MADPDGTEWTRLMRCGDWAAAWPISDAALAARGGQRDWGAPRHLQEIWDGSPLQGRRVLVRCYHGLGDTIQFARFIPQLRAIAGEVTSWVQPALIPLLRTMPGLGWMSPLHDGTPAIAYDVDIEIMELAHALRVTPETLPAEVPYLHPRGFAAPAPAPGLAVGLVWAAGAFDPARSVPLHLLEPLAEVPGVRLHILQHGPAMAERPPGFGMDAAREEIMVLAALMRGLDLVITVDTMPAHLAGALGVPVWLMLRHDADWRWMQGRDTSPWYPTMRLFRQLAPGAWAAVAREVVTCLRHRAKSAFGR